jgi:hypothetical protein
MQSQLTSQWSLTSRNCQKYAGIQTMPESLAREFIRFLAITFPLLIPLCFYNRLFTVCKPSRETTKEISARDEAMITCTFLLAMLVAFTVPPYIQLRLFSLAPPEDALFSWRLSQDLIYPLAAYMIQGLSVAFLIHFLIAKCIFGDRFDTEIFYGNPQPRHYGLYANAYSFRWFVHPAGKVRVMLWLGGFFATSVNLALEGSFLEINRETVRQNFVWVNKKDYPIPSIQQVVLTRHYGRYGRVDWSIKLHLKDGDYVPLLGGFQLSPTNVERLSQALNQASNETIEFQKTN